MKKVLFVCRFNCFRSQIAAGFFNKYCPRYVAVANSAGLIEGDGSSAEVIKYARKNKLKLTKPNGLKRKIVNKQDIFVIVADDVPPQIFSIFKERGKEVKVWKIKDLWKLKNFHTNKKKDFMHTTDAIKKKVLELIEELSKK